MERLTKRTSNGVAYMAIADTLSKSEQEIEGSRPILEGLYAMFQKLAEYEDAEEAGLMIKLPVKVGQKVYFAFTEGVYEFEVTIIEWHGTALSFYCLNEKEDLSRNFSIRDMGTRVFVIREEAEAARGGSRLEG